MLKTYLTFTLSVEMFTCRVSASHGFKTLPWVKCIRDTLVEGILFSLATSIISLIWQPMHCWKVKIILIPYNNSTKTLTQHKDENKNARNLFSIL